MLIGELHDGVVRSYCCLLLRLTPVSLLNDDLTYSSLVHICLKKGAEMLGAVYILLQKLSLLLYWCYNPVWVLASSTICSSKFFLGWGHQPHTQLAAWRSRDYTLYGHYPLTSLSWVDLPGAHSPTRIALWPIGMHIPSLHSKAVVLKDLCHPPVYLIVFL